MVNIMGIINKIRHINLQKAGICSVIIGVIGIFVHILLICQIIPYTWLNGGRSLSFDAAKSTSSSSIIIIAVDILITLAASQLIPVRFSRFFGKVLTVFLVVMLPLSFMGIILQLFGSPFEKCIMSLVTLVGFCADVRIAVEKRW